MQEFDVVARIQELCQARSWTYYRLAKESGIPYSTLSTMLHKTNVPSVPSLMKICNGFGITLAQFFSDQDEAAKLTTDQKQCLVIWAGWTAPARSWHWYICRGWQIVRNINRAKSNSLDNACPGNFFS